MRSYKFCLRPELFSEYIFLKCLLILEASSRDSDSSVCDLVKIIHRAFTFLFIQYWWKFVSFVSTQLIRITCILWNYDKNLLKSKLWVLTGKGSSSLHITHINCYAIHLSVLIYVHNPKIIFTNTINKVFFFTGINFCSNSWNKYSKVTEEVVIFIKYVAAQNNQMSAFFRKLSLYRILHIYTSLFHAKVVKIAEVQYNAQNNSTR